MKDKARETNKSWNPKVLALGGILLALCLVAMYFASFMPGVEMSLLALASLAIYIFCMEAGLGGGFALYIAAALLSLILAPNKVMVLPFLLFFGVYPPFKYLVDRRENRSLRVGLKILFLGLMTGLYIALAVFLLDKVVLWEMPSWLENLPDFAYLPILLVGGVVVELAFDIILTHCGNYYLKKFKNKTAFAGAGFSAKGGTAAPQKVPDIKLWAGDGEGGVSDSDVSDSDSKTHL